MPLTGGRWRGQSWDHDTPRMMVGFMGAMLPALREHVPSADGHEDMLPQSGKHGTLSLKHP
jgi:hypothetical protein